MTDQADIDKIVALLKKEKTEADDVTVIEQLLAANPSLAQATPEFNEGQGQVPASHCCTCPTRVRCTAVADVLRAGPAVCCSC